MEWGLLKPCWKGLRFLTVMGFFNLGKEIFLNMLLMMLTNIIGLNLLDPFWICLVLVLG